MGGPSFFVREYYVTPVGQNIAFNKKTWIIRGNMVGRYTLFKLKQHDSPNNTQLVSMEGVFVQTYKHTIIRNTRSIIS